MIARRYANEQREFDCKSRTQPFARARRVNSSGMRLDQVAHDGKSKAKPPVPSEMNFFRLPEAVEDIGQKLTWDAGAGVVYNDTGASSGALQPDFDLPPCGRKLHGVGEQIRHHLLQAVSVALDGGGRRIVFSVESDLLCGEQLRDALKGSFNHGDKISTLGNK